MVAETGWREFNLTNEHGEPFFLRIHAGKMIGEGWREEDCPELSFRIRKNRIIGDVLFTDKELEMIGAIWQRETGQKLPPPLYEQTRELIKTYYEGLDEDDYPPPS